MAEVIDGRKLAEEIIGKIKLETASFVKSHNIRPGLTVIIVGEDAASQVYVASKSRKAEECGFHSVTHKLDADTHEETLIDLVRELNEDPFTHGILVQLPLPVQIREQEVIRALLPEKDVDGFHYANIGKLAVGAAGDGGFVPCTPAGIMMMIRRSRGNDLSGLDAVVVGRSNIVGKPLASLLLSANATTTVAHSRTRDLPDVVRSADILVAAVGKPEIIRGSWIKPGATVIDVGINRVGENKEGRPALKGDVEYDTASIVARDITPVPGGVGPMTIAMLMANTFKAACRATGIQYPDLADIS